MPVMVEVPLEKLRRAICSPLRNMYCCRWPGCDFYSDPWCKDDRPHTGDCPLYDEKKAASWNALQLRRAEKNFEEAKKKYGRGRSGACRRE